MKTLKEVQLTGFTKAKFYRAKFKNYTYSNIQVTKWVEMHTFEWRDTNQQHFTSPIECTAKLCNKQNQKVFKLMAAKIDRFTYENV